MDGRRAVVLFHAAHDVFSMHRVYRVWNVTRKDELPHGTHDAVINTCIQAADMTDTE